VNINFSNKKFGIFLILICVMILVFNVNIFAKTVIRLSNQFPPSHYISKSMDFFCSKVEEYSQEKIEIKHFSSAQLYNDNEIIEALQEGNIELGLVPINKWSGMIPASEIFLIPFAFEDIFSVGKIIDAGAGELLDKAFQEKGVKVVSWVNLGTVQFWNNKRPIRELKDFKGLKIRAFANIIAETIKALGGAPLIMSSSEMYMALERGTIDGVTTGMPAAVSRKIYEVQKYLTICNYAMPEFMIQANLDWWNNQSKTTKEILIMAGEDTEKYLEEKTSGFIKDARKVIEEEGSTEIYVLSPEERNIFIEATETVRDNYAERAGELGKKLLNIVFCK